MAVQGIVVLGLPSFRLSYTDRSIRTNCDEFRMNFVVDALATLTALCFTTIVLLEVASRCRAFVVRRLFVRNARVVHADES